MSDERDRHLDEVLLGGREPVVVRIVEPDPAWAERFAGLRERVEQAVPAPPRVAVDHIGSTAVPGLAAKPIVDLLLTVVDVEDEGAYVAPLEAAGFVLRVREPGHRMLRTPERDGHLHVVVPGDPAVADWLDLRDHLRGSTPDRELYAATKRRLAERDWSDMNHYADAKSDVIREMLSRARAAPRSGG